MNRRNLYSTWLCLALAVVVIVCGVNQAGAQLDPGGIPHYFGPYPNYANSPAPVSGTLTTPTTAGNPLLDRTYASDFPVGTGILAPVLVVVPTAVMPTGTLQNFQTWNQASNGGSPFPSAGNIFHAYVLRPTGIANQYTVIYDSGLLTVPNPTVPGVSEPATFPVGPVPVQAGDVIGFYGQGIPVDIIGTGTDILSYPAPAAPVQGSIITLGVDAGFPIYPQARTYSIAAVVDVTTTVISGGIRKFVDPLPGLSVAVPDTITYPGSDYYEIALRQYTQKMHSDLPPTTLRGYVQINNGTDALGSNTIIPAPISYLGPLIVSQRDRPVRVKFINQLPTGAGGNLFLPVDTSVMGAGMGPDGMTMYTQNRATLHLHGNNTVWISDGTPHQWITPAGEVTSYPAGVSVVNVPDMPDPGPGSMTFYYTNAHSARLMFYHDHSYGITRLNVYAGEAAGYLVTDQVEQDLINGTNASGVNPTNAKALPDLGIPLVIQDKTFVDANTIANQDPTWNWGTTPPIPNTGDLWYPHVYMPNQNPWDVGGMNPFGRWHYGPWFWPPATNITFGPIPNPYCQPTPPPAGSYPNGPYDCSLAPWEPPYMPATPNPSSPAEGFMDTPIVNGMAYPFMEVEPKAYRFRILNAADDRFFNLQLYMADATVITQDGRINTEVKMVPAVPTIGFPAGWPTDGREGGVPDPITAGPSFIQIGTEGGFLPKPVALPMQPVGWNLDQTNFDFGNVNKGTLILGTAERADVIVDFSAYAGKTLILYNDAPAPFPAIDPRYDYYTGGPDQTDIGGAPSTLPGYGPNTRTIMQIKVGTSVTTPFTVDVATLESVFAKTATKRGVFEASQDEVIIPQAEYNSAYNAAFPIDAFVRIYETSKTFQTVSGTTVTIPFQPKAIQDEMGEAFDTDYGRMSAMLGLELPASAAGAQNFMLYPFASPPVEILKGTVYGTPIGSLDDGTQIWKITHNGVDTHTIHTHLFNAQLINRVAWDNALRLPDLNELGWKETFRVNPLQDTIIALRPILPNVPFQVPNSIRPLDPTMPLGVFLKAPLGGFKDPAGTPVTVTNHLVNFGWEYVYHCHLLAHEEMDMMHSVAIAVAPLAPSNLAAVVKGNKATLTWTDNSLNETGFVVQRAGAAAGPWTTIGIVPAAAGMGATVTFIDPNNLRNNTPYYYQVMAANAVGDSATAGFPTMTVNSAFSNMINVMR